MKTTGEFIDAALLPQLEAITRAAIKRNGEKPRTQWITVLPQAVLQADGDLKITAIALPADLAHQIKELIGDRLVDCYALTQELMTDYIREANALLAEEAQP